VPQIVSPELWEMANRALDMNRRSASRNSKHEYLLSGLIRCATCGRVWTGTASWAYSGHPKPEDRDKHKRIYYYRYRCGINRRLREERDEVGCQQKMIRASVLDTAVWQIVCEVLTQPQLILELLDRDFESRHNKQLREQIELIEHELARIEREFERERAAYLAGAYTPSEYAQIRSKLRDRNDQLIIDKRRVEGSMLTAEQVEAQKNMIVEIAEHARRIGLGLDAPFEVRKAVIRTLIDEIILDANAGEFELRGVIRGKHQIPAKIPDTSTARIEHISVEMSAAQSSRTVEEIWAHSKMAEEDRQMLQEKSWREGVRASCPNCEAPLAKNVKFCPECGAKIKGDPHCTECGSKLLPGAKFCPECGTKVGG
jgi:hypothetical protein